MMRESQSVDVVIVTAMEDELKELREIGAGSPDEKWAEDKDASGYPYFRRWFEHQDGGHVRVAAASAAVSPDSNICSALSRLTRFLRNNFSRRSF